MTREIDYNAGAWIFNDPFANNKDSYNKASYLFATSIESIAESTDVIFASSREDAVAQIQNLYPIDPKITIPQIANVKIGTWSDTISVSNNYFIEEQDNPKTISNIDIDELIENMRYINTLNVRYSLFDGKLNQNHSAPYYRDMNDSEKRQEAIE